MVRSKRVVDAHKVFFGLHSPESEFLQIVAQKTTGETIDTRSP